MVKQAEPSAKVRLPSTIVILNESKYERKIKDGYNYEMKLS